MDHASLVELKEYRAILDRHAVVMDRSYQKLRDEAAVHVRDLIRRIEQREADQSKEQEQSKRHESTLAVAREANVISRESNQISTKANNIAKFSLVVAAAAFACSGIQCLHQWRDSKQSAPMPTNGSTTSASPVQSQPTQQTPPPSSSAVQASNAMPAIPTNPVPQSAAPTNPIPNPQTNSSPSLPP